MVLVLLKAITAISIESQNAKCYFEMYESTLMSSKLKKLILFIKSVSKILGLWCRSTTSIWLQGSWSATSTQMTLIALLSFSKYLFSPN
jgi:hypothetical protein